MKKNFQLIVAIMLCGFGCGLLLAGFCCPPLAEIHHSVLIAFGEILTFSGSLIGIDYKYRYREWCRLSEVVSLREVMSAMPKWSTQCVGDGSSSSNGCYATVTSAKPLNPPKAHNLRKATQPAQSAHNLK